MVVASLVVAPLALLALCMLSCTLLRLKGETDERAARDTDRSSAGEKRRRAA
jgi:hypothetical protein